MSWVENLPIELGKRGDLVITHDDAAFRHGAMRFEVDLDRVFRNLDGARKRWRRAAGQGVSKRGECAGSNDDFVGAAVNDRREDDFSRYWAGLELLERISETGAALSSEEVAATLGTRSVKGIGAALSGTRLSLEQAGVRLDEAVRRRTVRRRSEWTAGPRIRQARHVLEKVRRRWMKSGPAGELPVEDVTPGYEGPVLVLRALKSRGAVYRVGGGMAELDEILDDPREMVHDDELGTIGEVFIDRIEPGRDAHAHPVPEGYGENGIWIRGWHDYAQPRVAGAIGTGRFPTMIAWIGEAGWVERRLPLVDAVGQVEAVDDGSWITRREQAARWRNVDGETRFRYVEWIGSRGLTGPLSAPPLRMRLRCWYEVVVETAERKRVVLRAEGLRGDHERTAARAAARWREAHPERAGQPVALMEVRVAKRQPRPVPGNEFPARAGMNRRRRDTGR